MGKGKWGRVILREICDSVNYGYTASAKSEPIGPKFLRITDIVPNHIDWPSVPHCMINEDKLGKYLLKKDDIVIARTGATTGYAKRIRTNQHAIFASYLVRIRINSKCNSKYIGYVIESDEYKQFIQLNIGGAAQPHANAQILTSFPILLPPLPTQHIIASILSTYDDLIENNTRRIKILEDMAQTLYREWFVHYRFPGHENVPMVQSELGKIPQGWEVGKFKNIVENVKEKVKPGKHLNPLPYVPIDCIPRHSISLMEHKPSSEAKSSLIAFKRNDILFGAMRSYFHKVSLAPFNGITRQTCFVLRSKNANNYPFDLITTFQDSTVEYSSNHSTGSTIPYATWDLGLAIMPIVIPPNSLIKQYSDVVTPLLNSIQMMLKKNTSLRQTRDLLLPKLISGEIDVSDLDIDKDCTI